MMAMTEPDRGLAPTYIYLYGVADRGFELPSGDTTGAGLQLTPIGRVAAVHTLIERSTFDDLDSEDISETSRLAELARHHDRTLQTLAGAGTVLPVRLGTLFPDIEAMLALIAETEDGLVEQLDRVRGCHEWAVRVRERRESAATDEADSTGTEYLQHRRDERDARNERREMVLATMTSIDDTLSRLADAIAGPGVGTSLSMSRAYLVDDGAQADFAAAVTEAAAELAELRCTLAVSGPLPAYSFVGVQWGVSDR
jgi:gas vesicle protein GvpL/GvpF